MVITMPGLSKKCLISQLILNIQSQIGAVAFSQSPVSCQTV